MLKYLGNVWMMRNGLIRRTRVPPGASSARRACAGGCRTLLRCARHQQSATVGFQPSLSDRFNQLFGRDRRPSVKSAAGGGHELYCPPVHIRAGASTYGVAPPGKQPVGSELRYQATITRTARDCTRTAVRSSRGSAFRAVSSPAPPEARRPSKSRFVSRWCRPVSTKGRSPPRSIGLRCRCRRRTSLQPGAEDIVYPVPTAATGDTYIFYIGFDPQALTPEPKPSRRKKK